jgi:hypothetical protein
MEYHEPIGNFMYSLDEGGNKVEEVEQSSGWYVSYVIYEHDVERAEKLKSVAIEKPIPFKYRVKNHQKTFFYRGT